MTTPQIGTEVHLQSGTRYLGHGTVSAIKPWVGYPEGAYLTIDGRATTPVLYSECFATEREARWAALRERAKRSARSRQATRGLGGVNGD